MFRRFLHALAVLLCCTASPAWAQEFPTKPIRLIVGYPPGGGSDVVARLIAQEMGNRLRQPVVVENKPGAGGNIGAAEVARAPKDGYTLFLGDTGTLVLSKAIYQNLSHDPDTDLTPVSMAAEHGFLLVVNDGLPVRTLQELIADARARPSAMSFASPGNGTPHHIAMELFKARAGVDILHVPYRGAAPATTDLISGQVQMMMLDPAASIANVRGGRIRALATLTPQRLPELPEVPTSTEAGIAAEMSNLWAIMAPAGTPAAEVELLSAAIQEAVRAPAVVSKLQDMGITPTASTPQQLAQRLEHEKRTTREAARRMNIQLD